MESTLTKLIERLDRFQTKESRIKKREIGSEKTIDRPKGIDCPYHLFYLQRPETPEVRVQLEPEGPFRISRNVTSMSLVSTQYIGLKFAVSFDV